MRNKGSKSTKKGKQKSKKINRNAEASVDELLSAAETASSSLDVERAINFYSKAAALLRMGRTSSSETRERDLVHVLEKLGESKVSFGEQDEAKQDFQEALELLEKESDKDIWYHELRSNLLFYVGQLSIEKEALETYKQGVSSLEICLNSLSDQTMDEDDASDRTLPELKKKLSGAYCSIAELYLTDLCFEVDAERECEMSLEKALQIKDVDGEPQVDALQTMASLRLSQESRRSEAVTFILRAYSKMKVGSEALASLVGLRDQEVSQLEDQATELTEVEAANNLPEFEFRCQTAKLLLECAGLLSEKSPDNTNLPDEHNQCISAAISVLGSLLAQNDEVVEIWFLTGCAYASRFPPNVDTARYYFQKTLEMLGDIKKALLQESQYADDSEKDEIDGQLEANQAQIDDVQNKLRDIADGSTMNMEEGD